MMADERLTEDEDLTEDEEIEIAKATACRNAQATIFKALQGWDIDLGIRVEIVEYYSGEDIRIVKRRMLDEYGMEAQNAKQ
jgi:hypothetical protein